jgi:hypothetical protein
MRCITLLSQSRNETRRGSDGSIPSLMFNTEIKKTLLFANSVAEPEPHHFCGAGAVTECGSDSPGAKLNLKHRLIIKNVTNSNSFLLFFFTLTTI